MPVVVTDSSGDTSVIESIVFNNGTDEHILYQEPIVEVSGSLPLAFTGARQRALDNYTVHGTAEGAGVETSGTEPAGYKIPLTMESGETENLWDEDYENISTSLTYKPINVGNGSFTLSTDTPLGNGGSSLFLMPGQQSSGATTAMYGAYDGSPRTVTSVDGYVTLVYRVYDNKDPRNYQTMLNEGSTALPYIPHRYTATYPLYIGDTKLGEEEYVDYGEQKVWKRTENLFDKNSTSNFGFYLNVDGSVTTESITKTSWVSDYIPVKEGGNYFLSKTGSTRGKFYKDVFTPYQTTSFDFSALSGGITFNIPSTVKYVRFTINASQGLNGIMFVEGSTAPPSYIPYLQPTDPPSPLPAITAYQGENMLSSTETVGEVTVKGRLVDTTN